MKKITFLISGNINLILKNYNTFFKNLEKEAKIKIIDVKGLQIGKKTKSDKINNSNLSYEYVKISTVKKFKQMIANNQENLFCLLSLKLEDFLIFYHLKKNKTNLISFDIVNTIKFGISLTATKSKYFVNLKIFDKKFFLFLSYIKLITKFDYSFLCREINFNEKSFLSVVKKNFFGDIYKINNIFVYKNKKNVNEKKYITVLDCFFHPEVYFSKNQIEKDKEGEYFSKLTQLLEMLSIKYKKKFIISPHPKCPVDEYKKYFDESKLNLNETTYEIINKSYLIMCSNSSLMNYIYMNNINFLYLKWKHFSKYEKQFTDAWEKELPFNSIDLETKETRISKNTFLKNTFDKDVSLPHITLLNFLSN